MALSDNIKKIRESRGLTADELGAAAGVTQSMITKYETGVRVPNVIIACAIAKRLGVTVEKLVFGEG